MDIRISPRKLTGKIAAITSKSLIPILLTPSPPKAELTPLQVPIPARRLTPNSTAVFPEAESPTSSMPKRAQADIPMFLPLHQLLRFV